MEMTACNRPAAHLMGTWTVWESRRMSTTRVFQLCFLGLEHLISTGIPGHLHLLYSPPSWLDTLPKGSSKNTDLQLLISRSLWAGLV